MTAGESRDAAPRPSFHPVILGADIGVYALARACHEYAGVRSTIIATAVLGPVADSAIIEAVVADDADTPEGVVRALLEVGSRLRAADPATPLVLLANSDWFVRVVVEHRDALEELYVLAYLDREQLDLVSDKGEFARVCGELGIGVPRTIIQDFVGSDEPSWTPEPVDVGYPLIAKAASSAEYQHLRFEGKAKVYEIGSPTELSTLWDSLRTAGFRGRFIVQELVPGDDTYMRSVTAYVDSHGVSTLMCTAHVLLEEHTPSGLGNPAAMITDRDDELIAQANRFLAATSYRGFANFDVKVDPRTGQYKFFEVNPRIGRNNFYVTAAGANPIRFLVEDRVLGRAVEPVIVDEHILYSIVPTRLLLRYVLEPTLRSRVKNLVRARRVRHPLRYAADASWRRRRYARLAGINQIRKFLRHYPRPTTSGF